MNNENNKQMKENLALMKEYINKKYEISLWQRFKDGFGFTILGFLLLLILSSVVFLITFLIDSPISLAIICGTILLILFGARLR